MTKKEKGTTIASLGGLCTILSMTSIENNTWELIAAIAGVVFALYGVILIRQDQKDQKQQQE